MQLLFLGGKGREGKLRNEKQLKASQDIFWCLFLPSAAGPFQSQSLKICSDWKQGPWQCSQFHQAQCLCEMWHKTSCCWLSGLKTTVTPTEALPRPTQVFLTTKVCPGNPLTGPSGNKGSWASEGLAIFPDLIPITNSLLYRSINILHFSFFQHV